jgi:hypothetical protein
MFLSRLIMLVLLVTAALAQPPDYHEPYFTARLGEPAQSTNVTQPDSTVWRYVTYGELWRGHVEVVFGTTGRAMFIRIYAPNASVEDRGDRKQQLAALRNLMDTLVPVAQRGRPCGSRPPTIGNCINISTETYEHVVVSTNDDSCYNPWISIAFRASECQDR